MNNKFYTDDISILQEEVSLCAKNVSYADLYLQNVATHSISYENGKPEQLTSALSAGAGARIIKNNHSFLSSSDGTMLQNALSAFKNVAEIADERLDFADNFKNVNVFTDDLKLARPNFDFFDLIDKKFKSLDTSSKYIKHTRSFFSVAKKQIVIIKGNGSIVCRDCASTVFSVGCVVEKDGVIETASERRCLTVPEEKFWQNDNPVAIAEQVFKRAILMLEASPCPAGVMNVILDGRAGGTIIHEACGHGLEADIVEKESSVFAKKLGCVVAPEYVTMLDDATIDGAFGSYDFDDEGTKAQKTVLIENGILKNYLTDISTSLTYGYDVTGNGRRQSYKYLPIPRMSNTFLAPGNTSLGEMLDMMRNGLYVVKMGGGEVDATSGNFVFNVTEGYLVEDGKITRPVKGATLAGNGPKSLMQIKALGSSMVLDPGYCGKNGQTAYVTDGQPTILIENMVVGGSEL